MKHNYDFTFTPEYDPIMDLQDDLHHMKDEAPSAEAFELFDRQTAYILACRDYCDMMMRDAKDGDYYATDWKRGRDYCEQVLFEYMRCRLPWFGVDSVRYSVKGYGATKHKVRLEPNWTAPDSDGESD